MVRSLGFVLWLAGCGGLWGKPADPGLSVDQIAGFIRAGVDDKPAWAAAVRQGLLDVDRMPNEDHVCQVLAIIEQESSYQADPPVPNLAEVVEKELNAKVEEYGFLGKFTAAELLSATPSGQAKSFGERLKEVKTEQDVDRLFREMMDFHQQRIPLLAESVDLFAPRLDEKFNPITTAGSMQVSVGFAIEQGAEEGLDATEVRDRLYTIQGGVKYGIARLFAHEADYAKPAYRFADYNAGMYSSRNAAFQRQLATITGRELAPDGDLMIGKKPGTPSKTDGESLVALLVWRARFAPDLAEVQLRKDVRLEKTLEFEQTETWRRVRATFKEKQGKDPSYAVLPTVALDSPKLKQGLSTKWFAERVEKRYKDCLKRQ